MSAIFRAPVALQDMLATKTVGRNPAVLQEVVQPSLELAPFYLAGIPFVRTGRDDAVGTAAANTYVAAATVPAGEFWLLKSISVKIVPTAGYVHAVPWIAEPGGNPVWHGPAPQHFTFLPVTLRIQTSAEQWGNAFFPLPASWSFGYVIVFNSDTATSVATASFDSAHQVLTV
jgi:hypothetical protein